MAVAASRKSSGGSASAASSYNTASVSLTAGRLYLLAVWSNSSTGTANQPTVSGAGQTWVADKTRLDSGASQRRITVFRCLPAANNSGALTIAFGGQTQTNGFGWLLDEFTGIAPGNNGANAVVQSAGNDSANGAVSSLTATLAAFARSGNAAWSCVDAPNAAATLTAEAGYTNLGDVTAGLGDGNSMFKATSDTTPTWSIDSKVISGLITYEINALQVQNVAGGIDNTQMTGALAKTVNKRFAGALDASHIVGGLVARAIKKLLVAGGITPSGGVARTKITFPAGFRLTNVTRATTLYVRFSSLTFTDARPCQLATLDAILDDKDGTITIAEEDEIKLEQKITNTSVPVIVFAGDITSLKKTDHGNAQGPRVYGFAAQDFTARLADNVVTTSRDVSESVTNRVAWIMGWSNRGLTTSHVGSIATTVGAFDYTGMSVLAALQQVAQLVGATLYVDDSKDLHFFTGIETNPAPFDLTRPASPPTSYPYRDFDYETSTPDLAHAVFVQGDGVSTWRVAAGAPTGNTRQERSVNDQTIKTLADAQALGDSLLAKWSAALISGRLSTFRPGLRGAMQVRISDPAWSIDATFVVTSVSMQLLGPALPKYAVTFSDHYACQPGQAAFATAAVNGPVQVKNDVTQIIGDVSAAGANVVKNSSFESSGDWTVGSIWNAQYTSANPYNGTYTARAAPTGTDAGELISSAFIAVDRTQDWWLSFESYVSAYTSGTARCVLREYNAGGTLLASTNIDITAAETTWGRHSTHFGPTATDSRIAFNASTTKVKVVFLTTGSATLTWEIDAIQFERSAQLTSYAPAPYEIADSTVGTSKIVTGAVVTASLAAGTVIALVTNTGATVVIDGTGLAVTNGKITVVNGSGTTIIDGTSRMYRIVATGNSDTGVRTAGVESDDDDTLTGLGTMSEPRSWIAHASDASGASGVKLGSTSLLFKSSVRAATLLGSGNPHDQPITSGSEYAEYASFLTAVPGYTVMELGGIGWSSSNIYGNYHILSESVF